MNQLIRTSFTLVLVIFFSSLSSAKTIQRKPNQAEHQPISIRVLYGEKVTLFSITKTKSGGQVDFSNNSGAKQVRAISMKDFNFLSEKVAKISGISNDKAFCIRNFISIETEGKKLIGCIGASNEFARGVQETTNLVSILF